MAFRVDVAAEGLAKAIERELAHANTAAVREATDGVKAELRAETAAAFRGNRLPKSWRSKVYPQGQDSIDAAGWVEVRNSAAKIIDTAVRGAVIRASNGFWLAIPTPQAGRFGLKAGAGGFGVTTNTRSARERITPGGFERRTGFKLRFVPDGGRRAFLVVDAAQLTRGLASPYRGKGRGSKLYGPSGRTIVVFTLVPQVTMKKRLDLDAIATRAAQRYPGLLAKNWRR